MLPLVCGLGAIVWPSVGIVFASEVLRHLRAKLKFHICMAIWFQHYISPKDYSFDVLSWLGEQVCSFPNIAQIARLTGRRCKIQSYTHFGRKMRTFGRSLEPCNRVLSSMCAAWFNSTQTWAFCSCSPPPGTAASGCGTCAPACASVCSRATSAPSPRLPSPPAGTPWSGTTTPWE